MSEKVQDEENDFTRNTLGMLLRPTFALARIYVAPVCTYYIVLLEIEDSFFFILLNQIMAK